MSKAILQKKMMKVSLHSRTSKMTIKKMLISTMKRLI
jgi:hypothetical protein